MLLTWFVLVGVRIEQSSFLYNRVFDDTLVGRNGHSDSSPRRVITLDPNNVVVQAGVFNVLAHLCVTLGQIVVPLVAMEIAEMREDGITYRIKILGDDHTSAET